MTPNPETEVVQKDQLGTQTGQQYIKPQYTAQATLQYKTFLKRTFVEALQNAFVLYEDETLAKTKIGTNYAMDEADFPNIVVKFYEQSVKNMGVGHAEWGHDEEQEELGARAQLKAGSGEVTGLDTTKLLQEGKTEIKGLGVPKETFVKKILSQTSILMSKTATETRTGDITFVDVFVERYIEYHHYMYKGDISLEVYGLNSPDRDMVSDAIVEVVAMGVVGEEGLTFQERIYNTIGASNFPYSKWHFIAVNTDMISGFGEQQMIAPWMPEDVFTYMAEYRVPILGEFYSITPTFPKGRLELVKEVDIYPWDTADSYDTPPKDFPHGVVPKDKYIPITKHVPKLPFQTYNFEPTLGLSVVPKELTVTGGPSAGRHPW